MAQSSFLFTSKIGRLRAITIDKTGQNLPRHPGHPDDEWVFAHLHPLDAGENGVGYRHDEAISAIAENGYFIF